MREISFPVIDVANNLHDKVHSQETHIQSVLERNNVINFFGESLI